MANVSSSPLDHLNLREIAELSVDRYRATKKAPQLSNHPLEDFAERGNINNYFKIHGASDEEIKRFLHWSKSLGDETLNIDDTLKNIGFENDNQLSKAWQHVKTISNSFKALLSPNIRRLKTSDPITSEEEKNILFKIRDLSKSLVNYVWKDILLDLNIDTLKTYFKLA